MNSVWRFWTSSLGKKYLMAITGLGLFGFVIVHMVGNLQIFLGPEAINHYGSLLHSNPELLWPARLGLGTFVVIHFWTAIALTLENRAARDQRYAVKQLVAASIASRTMMISGAVLLAYIVYHLLHFTLLATNPGYRSLEYLLPNGTRCHDVYGMMIQAFRQPAIAAAYVISMGCLCLHLSHGAGSWFQSLGLKNEAYVPRIDRFALISAWILFLGYSSVPLAVLTGLVK